MYKRQVYVVNPETHLIYELVWGNDELVDTCIYQPVPEFCHWNFISLSGHPNTVADKLAGTDEHDKVVKAVSYTHLDVYKRQAQKQYDFFQNYVAPLKQKVAVIISDALRYEVAHELVNELHKDEKNVSELSFRCV